MYTMPTREYSKHLGIISDNQFQAVLDHFDLVQAYAERKSLRPGFAKRFPVYMLLDRLIIWEYFQRNGNVPWNKQWTFRDWASRYISYLL